MNDRVDEGMRCAFVIQHINALGGTERSACAVMNGLVRRGMAVHLIELVGRGPSAYPLDSSVVVGSLFAHPVKLLNSWLRIVWRLARYLRRNAVDTLIVVEATHALYGIAAARLAGVRCVVWEHFNVTVTLGRRKRVWGRHLAARYAQAIVVLTEADRMLWRARLRPRARLEVVPNIAPAVGMQPYDVGARVVLTVGRLAEQKGYDMLLRAWAMVTLRPEAAAWTLRIRGDGPERDSLRSQAAGLPRVHLAPATKTIADDFMQAGLYVCSSRYEGLPMVLLEASAAGVPIVSFDCVTGPADIVERGVSGCLVPPGDIAALANALLALMADDARRLRLSSGARRQAERFQEGPVIARWVALLQAR